MTTTEHIGRKVIRIYELDDSGRGEDVWRCSIHGYIFNLQTLSHSDDWPLLSELQGNTYKLVEEPPERDDLLSEIKRENERMKWFLEGIGAGFRIFDEAQTMNREEFGKWVREEFENLHSGADGGCE
jgi:hypothetical protein